MTKEKIQDQPVAWGMEKDGVILDVICPAEHDREEGSYTVPLYTTTQRTWVGLIDEEQSFVYDQVKQIVGGKPFWVKFADAIEAKLKEKNT